MISELATEHFKVRLNKPYEPNVEPQVCLGENDPRGANNTIYFKRSEIKELIALLKLADSEFRE